MTHHRSGLSGLARWCIASAIAAGMMFPLGYVTSGQDQQSDTRMPDVHEMSWPQGVEMLAAQVFTLEEGEVQWRVTTLEAAEEPGQSMETGRGVMVPVNGTLLVEVNGTDYVRLETGAALTFQSEDEIAVASATEAPVEYLMIELLPYADDNTTDESNLVGPVEVGDGGYALVLLNLPADMTTDMAAEQVIEGALRPGVSIAYTDEGIPDRLETDEDYHRFIAALYPAEDQATPVATSEPTSSPVAAQSIVPPTAVPVQPTAVPVQPTVPPTSVPAPTPVPTEAPAPTATMQPEPTATAEPQPTATAAPPPTEPPAPEPTQGSMPEIPTPVPPTIPTPVPPDLGDDD